MSSEHCKHPHAEGGEACKAKGLEHTAVSPLAKSPAVVVVNHIVNLVTDHWALHLTQAVRVATSEVHRVEVEVLLLIKVWKAPVDSDVFKCQIIPLIRVRIIRNAVLMDILAFPESSIDFDELHRVLLLGSAALVAVLSVNPASVNNDSGTLDAHGIALLSYSGS